MVFVFGLFPYLPGGEFEHATAIETMKRTFEITVNNDPHHFSFGWTCLGLEVFEALYADQPRVEQIRAGSIWNHAAQNRGRA